MNTKLLTVLSILICLIWPDFSQGFWLGTHKKITSTAIGTTNLNSLLESQIGITNSMGFEITVSSETKTLQEWLEFGSQQEDEPMAAFRYLNHFYNPLDDSGLYGTFLSSYNWANDSRNEWRWYIARSAYYRALTGWSENDRNVALALAFRAIGQVTHLMQDSAVPSHTRNDGHNPDGFEQYADTHLNSLNFSYYYPFANSLTSISSETPRQFWDSDNYTLENPIPSADNTLGLAEYSNANFFSDDTVANNYSSFPYPKIYTDTTIDVRNITNSNTGNTYPRMYYLKNYDGETNNGQGYLLSTVAFLDDWRAMEMPIATTDQPFFPVLDENVYKDYATLLIPRAVGYSAGLLNYFFRADMDMTEDPATPGSFFIENKTGEAMSGTFSLYYDYEDGTEVKRARVETWDLTDDKAISANGKSELLTFTEPTSPPAKEKDKYILVFNGKLGNEEGAVAGKVVDLDPIWEPWNEGEYTITGTTAYWNGQQHKETFTLNTPKRTWEGFFYYGDGGNYDQRANIRVEDGIFKFDDDYTFGWMETSVSENIPLSSCRLKMRIPHAALTDEYGSFYVGLTFTDGVQACDIRYLIAGFPSYSVMVYVGSGDIERSLSEDFNQVTSQDKAYVCGGSSYVNIGDINNWYLKEVLMTYGNWGTVSIAIDSIDFECQ